MATKAVKPDRFVGHQVREYRTRMGLTGADLIERLAALGHRMNRVTLSNIEGAGKTKRGVTIEELLAFAAALNVPPALLLFPIEGEVEITPKAVVGAEDARRWLGGRHPLRRGKRPPTLEAFGEWMTNARPAHLFDALFECQLFLEGVEGRVKRAEFVGEPDAGARAAYVEALGDYVKVRRDMLKDGLRPPAMPARWKKAADELGFDETKAED